MGKPFWLKGYLCSSLFEEGRAEEHPFPQHGTDRQARGYCELSAGRCCGRRKRHCLHMRGWRQTTTIAASSAFIATLPCDRRLVFCRRLELFRRHLLIWHQNAPISVLPLAGPC